MKKVLSTVALLALILSCGNRGKQMSPAEYIRYMEASPDMVKKVEAGSIVYTVQLATPEYMTSKELNGSNDKAAFSQRLKERKSSLFFLIGIESKDKNHSLNNEGMALYYGSTVVNDVSLQAGNVRLAPIVCHFENNLGLTDKNTLVTGFYVPDTLKEEVQFELNDRYAGNPLVKASFSMKDVSSLPSLKL